MKKTKKYFPTFFIWKNLFSIIIPLLASMQMWSRSAKYIRTHTLYVSFTLIIDLRNLSMVSIERKYNHFWMSLDSHAPSLLYKHSFSLFRYNLPDRDEIEFCKSDSRMMMLPSVFSLIFRRGQQTLFPLFPLPDFMEIIWPQQQIQNMNWKFWCLPAMKKKHK